MLNLTSGAGLEYRGKQSFNESCMRVGNNFVHEVCNLVVTAESGWNHDHEWNDWDLAYQYISKTMVNGLLLADTMTKP